MEEKEAELQLQGCGSNFDRNSFKAARKKAAGFKEYMYQRGCCSVSDHNEIRVPDLNKRKELKLALDTLELDSAQHSSLPQHRMPLAYRSTGTEQV